MNNDRELYHKKFKHVEVTVEKNDREQMIKSGIVWAIVLGLAIWYFTK